MALNERSDVQTMRVEPALLFCVRCCSFAYASVARGEEAAFAGEVRRPVEVVHPGETQVRVERVLHRLDEAVGALRREAFLPPKTENLDALDVAVDPWLEAADEAFTEEDR